MSDAMFMLLTGLVLLLGRDIPAVVWVAGVSLLGSGVLGLIVNGSKK